ncbi:MAG: hypothetical protein R2789_15770 [Microthrixaceae bacterium]
MFTSHHWPVWGVAESMRYLATQRDHKFLHDQTLRRANQGLTMLSAPRRSASPTRSRLNGATVPTTARSTTT